MIRVPGGKPHQVPPSHVQAPKEVAGDAKKSQETTSKPAKPLVGKSSIGRGPELDSRAIAVRLAVLATEAKKKEIAAEEFERILDEVIQLTKLNDPQAAFEEANRKLQKEIEIALQKIKDNKEKCYYLALSYLIFQMEFELFQKLFNYSDKLGFFIEVKKIPYRFKILAYLHLEGMQRGLTGRVFEIIRHFNKYNLFERIFSKDPLK